MTKADLPKHWKFISAIVALIAVTMCVSSLFIGGGLYTPLPHPYNDAVVYLNRLTGTVWICVGSGPAGERCHVWEEFQFP